MATNSSFDVVLNDLIERAGCTAAHLSERSGVSEATLSRYRNGSRVPSLESGAVAALASALCQLSQNQPYPLNYDETFEALELCVASAKPSATPGFARRFDVLCALPGVAMRDLATATNFDASFLSRVKSGQRRPADLNAFCFNVAGCVVDALVEGGNEGMLEEVANIRFDSDEAAAPVVQALSIWLKEGAGDEEAQPGAIQSFLEHLDAFDLNDYLAAMHFDQLKIPTVPFNIPGSKDYYQIEGMRAAELDFLRITATSKASKRVIMCSDMPMEDMAEDPDFAKKWMMGLGALMKRGIRLTMVHSVNRPMPELMLGLESWIPLYMTGLVEPLYIKDLAPSPFQHLDYVSDVASLHGECIKGFHALGRYRLEKGQREVAYQQSRMAAVLTHASPLMRIYREDQQVEFDSFMEESGQGAVPVDSSAFRNITISVKPGRWALIEKKNAPLMRFVVDHPSLVAAIESFVAPYGQEGFNK